MDGVVITYSQAGNITTRIRYSSGAIDSQYGAYYVSKDIVFDRQKPVKIDTITSSTLGNRLKEYNIYRNDTLVKKVSFYDGKRGDESDYVDARLVKRTIYYKNAPDTVQKIFYFHNGKRYKSQFFNLHGQLTNETSP